MFHGDPLSLSSRRIHYLSFPHSLFITVTRRSHFEGELYMQLTIIVGVKVVVLEVEPLAGDVLDSSYLDLQRIKGM